MSMNEVITTLRQMNRVEKMRVMQFLVLDLTKEEEALLSPKHFLSDLVSLRFV